MTSEVSHYAGLERAMSVLQEAPSATLRLDDDPEMILSELNNVFASFHDLPDENKPKVMVVNLLNVNRNPGSGFHPIGLGYLMGAIHSLDPDGFYRDGPDGGLRYYNEYQLPQTERTDEKFIDTVRDFKPDIILFTATTSQTRRIGTAISKIKEEKLKPLMVVGGVDAIVQPNVCLERTGADFALVGEGSIPVKLLIAGWKDSKFPLQLLPGLVVPEPDGGTTRYNKSVYFQNPDLYDPPKIQLTAEQIENGWELTVTRAFGCPYACPFCGSEAITKETTGHRAVRMKSEKAMLDEIEFGLQNNVSSIYFADDTLFLNEKIASSFLLKLKDLQLRYARDGKMVPWAASSRIAEINRHPHLLQLAVDAGCVEIEVGKESGSDELLRHIKNVGNYNRDMFRLLDNLKLYPQLRLGVNFILGLPGSTISDELQTIQLMADILDRKHPVSFHVHRFAPLPGTDYWDDPGKHGLSFDKTAVMDSLSTYGVEDLIQSSSLPHNQVDLLDEMLNSVLRIKGAVSFRSPYLAALTADERAGISTFVIPGESQREIKQATLEKAASAVDHIRQSLADHPTAGTLADAVRDLESNERYILSLNDLLKLTGRVICEQYKLPEYVVRSSTPYKEASSDIHWYISQMRMIRKHQNLRSRNPLLRSFRHNIPFIKQSRIVPTHDLSPTERLRVKQRLHQLAETRSPKQYLVKRFPATIQRSVSGFIDVEKRREISILMMKEQLPAIIEKLNSQTLRDRWRLLSDRGMLGGHEFTITGHIEQMFREYLELSSEHLQSSEDIFVGAIASVLHDIGKLGGSEDYYHPLRSAIISRKILDEIRICTTQEKQRILALIENHALIGNVTIHGEKNTYSKAPDDRITIRNREYSSGRLYSIGPISDSQYIRNSLTSFIRNPGDLDILLQMQMADTYAVKKDGSFLNSRTRPDFIRTYQRLKQILFLMHRNPPQPHI